MSTGIEWTDETWNPTTGCDRVSPGCDNCYALSMAARLKGMGSPAYQVDGDPRTSGPGFALQEHPGRLDQPLRWTRPRRIFVNSMSDLFHPRVSDRFIAQVFAVMALAGQHTFQVLTKRPRRMRGLLAHDHFLFMVDSIAADMAGAVDWERVRWPLPNVWLGTSVEDQQRADERIPPLLETPAAVRFLSMEPLLGPVYLRPDWIDFGDGRVDWIIVGGESGPSARPMHPDWVRALRDQAHSTWVPFFFKQWGAWAYTGSTPGGSAEPHVFDDGTIVWRLGKHAAGRELDGRTWDEFPQVVPA